MTFIIRRSLISPVFLILATSAFAGGPDGAPGLPHQWAPALKQAVGTAYESSGARSPVWFTVAEGIVTEVFYPQVDQAQVGDLQFIVTDGSGFFSEQKRDTLSRVTYSDPGATVQIEGEDRSGRYQFEQEILTDPSSPVLRIRTRLHWKQPGMRVFILFKPAIGNSGSLNVGSADTQGLYATRAARGRNGMVHASLVANHPWATASAGYVGFSDGWQDLSRHFRLTRTWPEAGPGNVALTGELRVPPGSDFTFELALGFGSSRAEATTYARTALLTVPFQKAREQYDGGWTEYWNGLTALSSTSTFERRSAQIIKMHEDKRRRGAIVASLSKPAIPSGSGAHDETGGYHLVWPRDLYHAALGLLAAGDLRTPIEVLEYFEATQNPDGSWPQNFWVDGTPYWRGLQMDEVAFPILLAWQLQRRGVHSPTPAELAMVRSAAAFIVSRGPTSPQDRWEEIGGYIPGTLAVEIAALRAATRLTGDPTYSRAANDWKGRLDAWTLVPEGPHGNHYYLRASPTGSPSRPEEIDLANNAGKAKAWDIIDGGFLDLVRYRVKPVMDPGIRNTLRIYESPGLNIAAGYRVGRSNAFIYRRYNRDGYGPGYVGGYWPLLAGERGMIAVEAGDFARAEAQLFMLESAALPSGHLPEQVISPTPLRDALAGRQSAIAGPGVACPLVWAHAEDLRLRRSIEDRAVFDAPEELEE